jgi:hypothetical protein
MRIKRPVALALLNMSSKQLIVVVLVVVAAIFAIAYFVAW